MNVRRAIVRLLRSVPHHPSVGIVRWRHNSRTRNPAGPSLRDSSHTTGSLDAVPFADGASLAIRFSLPIQERLEAEVAEATPESVQGSSDRVSLAMFESDWTSR